MLTKQLSRRSWTSLLQSFLRSEERAPLVSPPAVSRRQRGSRAGRSTGMVEALESRTLLSVTYTPVYTFTGSTDGTSPTKVVLDSSGDIYGITFLGGANGRGGIFEIPAGSTTPTVLHSFSGVESTGDNPSLVVDSSGNLYGTTLTGGTDNNGSIFEIDAATHTFNTIFSFPSALGTAPSPTITIDSAGNLYGFIQKGGTNGNGLVFKMAAGTHAFSILYNFTTADGANAANPVLDSAGNLYGTTSNGDSARDLQEIFKLTPGGSSISSVATFATGLGAATLDVGPGDVLYATTKAGGANNDGTLFTVNNGAVNVLYSFTGGADGAIPAGPVHVDAAGDIFGATASGGANGLGTLFEVAAGSTTPTVVATFTGTSGDTPGSVPQGGLMADSAGNLYGAAFNGGAANAGLVFKLANATTAGAPAKLAFTAQPTSGAPGALGTIAVAVEDASGNVVTSDNSQVTLSILSGPTGGTLQGTVTATAVNGVATFTGNSLAVPGTYVLQATDGTLTAATTSPFVLGAPATTAAKMVVKVMPKTGAAGTALSSIAVYLLDKKNHLVTTDSSLVTVSIAKGPTTTFSNGTLSVQAVGGIATFSDLVLDTAGKYQFAFTDGALKPAKAHPVTITPDLSSAHLSITQTPAPTSTVGAKLSALTVGILDQFSNPIKTHAQAVVSATSGPGAVSGQTHLPLNKGTATFKNLVLTNAGTYTLAVSTVGVTTTPVTFNETVSAATATITTPPSHTFKLGKPINVVAHLHSTAPHSVHYSGTATVVDSSNNVLATATVSPTGLVKAVISNLPAGTYTCTIKYTGDSSYLDTQSSPFTLTVA